MASSIRSKVGTVANLIPFNATNSLDTSQPDLNLAVTGIGDSIQYSRPMKANNCCELMLVIKLASGSILLQLAVGEPESALDGSNHLDFDGTPYALGINATLADTNYHFYKVPITPTMALADPTPVSQYPFPSDQVLTNLLYQFRIEENAGSPASYTINSFMLLEIAAIPSGRDYHVVTAGFNALPKDGAACNFSIVLV